MSIISSVSLLEFYEASSPPPGSQGSYPVTHAILRLRLENLEVDPRSQPAGTLSIVAIKGEAPDQKKVLLSTPITAQTLNGLEIREQGFHLTHDQSLIDSGSVQAVYEYTVGSQVRRAYSEVLPVSQS